MDSFPWEGLIVVTYGTIFGAALTGVIALFRRMGRVEADTRRVGEAAERADAALAELRDEVKEQGVQLRDAMTDFRVHMAEEAASVERLESLLVSVLDRREVA